MDSVPSSGHRRNLLCRPLLSSASPLAPSQGLGASPHIMHCARVRPQLTSSQIRNDPAVIQDLRRTRQGARGTPLVTSLTLRIRVWPASYSYRSRVYPEVPVLQTQSAPTCASGLFLSEYMGKRHKRRKHMLPSRKFFTVLLLKRPSPAVKGRPDSPSRLLLKPVPAPPWNGRSEISLKCPSPAVKGHPDSPSRLLLKPVPALPWNGRSEISLS